MASATDGRLRSAQPPIGTKWGTTDEQDPSHRVAGGDGRGMTLSATPALAVGPNQNATATAKIVKPLTLTWVQDLDLGTIVLSGAGAWAATSIGISSAGVFTCANSNVDLLGRDQDGAVQSDRHQQPGRVRSPRPTSL